MITTIIVSAALVFGAAFTLAWWLSPALRAWIERPKYTFQASVQDWDQSAGTGTREDQELR